jgi:ribosome-associated protein
MVDRPKPPEEESAEVQWRGPSRSQKKRDARAVGDIGIVLTKLSTKQLSKIPLDDDLRESILSCKDMSKGALARQTRYIAQQLNSATTDLEAIKDVLRELRLLP